MEQQLTDRQKVFIKRYYVHRNLTKAAIEAGFSPSSANRYGYTLIHKPVVRQAVIAMLSEVGQELDC